MSRIVSCFALLACFALPLADANQAKKATPKCPVKGNMPAKLTVSAPHNGGKVFFCCAGCCGAFKKTKDGGKFAANANVQLVVTGQAKQIKCPLKGTKLNPATKIEVAGAPICFCCASCKGKASKLKGAAQVNFLFNNKRFKTAFMVGKK